MDKLVSVIIPTFGRPTSIGTAIQSVLDQSYDSIEVVVIDDNVPDSEERALTEDFMQKYVENSKVNYYKHERNKGGCAARNTGIEKAKGELIAFLDDDDRYLPTYIEKMVARITEDKADMVYMTKAYCDDREYVWKSKDRGEYFPEGHIFTKVISGQCPICIFFLIQKTFIERIGKFDENLRGFQDCDIWFKASKEGKLCTMKQSLAVYTRDARERITANPYKREKALKEFEEKWRKVLTKEENIVFSQFVEMHQGQIDFNKVIYDIGKEKENELSFAEIWTTHLPLAMKLQITMIKLFGEKGNQIYRVLRFKICKNRFDFLKG